MRMMIKKKTKAPTMSLRVSDGVSAVQALVEVKAAVEVEVVVVGELEVGEVVFGEGAEVVAEVVGN
jgi:hypothetical protein